MQFSPITYFLVMALIEIGNLDTAPNRGRIPFCTPNLGIDYDFPTKIPNHRIRCLRSIDQVGSSVNLPSSDRIVHAVKEDRAVEKGVTHERLLNSHLLNERHFIRSPNEDISEALHAISRRVPSLEAPKF